MATIIDKLLNRDSETKPSPEELREIAKLAHDESERLARLVHHSKQAVLREAGIKEGLRDVEARVKIADGSLKAFEQQVAAGKEISDAAAGIQGRVQMLDQLVTSADSRIRKVEVRNGELNEARAKIEKLISTGVVVAGDDGTPYVGFERRQ